MVQSSDLDERHISAAHQALFREVNDRIDELSSRWTAPGAEYICECRDAECTEAVPLPGGAYREIRSHAGCFLVLDGHESAAVEDVIERNAGYLVVKALHAGAEVPFVHDPAYKERARAAAGVNGAGARTRG